MTVSCDPGAKPVQEEDTTSEELLEGDATPSQYQGSTGVVDDDNNNMVADENIQLKKQEFKGSFATPETQNYELTVIESDEYSFRLESATPEVKYIVTSNQGDVVIEQTSETKTVTLEPGDYVITATLDLPEGATAEPETEFIIYID
ncbi:hypothetical protein GO491_06775 [Flavobacteriaceae bacterium Ap0902]|nr:hypothetical protein [Flavobacteriaceae bacterium Ap0902]